MKIVMLKKKKKSIVNVIQILKRFNPYSVETVSEVCSRALNKEFCVYIYTFSRHFIQSSLHFIQVIH